MLQSQQTAVFSAPLNLLPSDSRLVEITHLSEYAWKRACAFCVREPPLQLLRGQKDLRCRLAPSQSAPPKRLYYLPPSRDYKAAQLTTVTSLPRAWR